MHLFLLVSLGPEVLFEATRQHLLLRCVNGARSACATVKMRAFFFEAFRAGGSDCGDGPEAGGNVVQCGVLIKSLLPALRPHRASRVAVAYEPADARLVIRLFCERGA